jgi:hypothetical protein
LLFEGKLTLKLLFERNFANNSDFAVLKRKVYIKLIYC